MDLFTKQNQSRKSGGEMSVNNLLLEIYKHYKKWWYAYIFIGGLIFLFGQNYKIAINVTDSLPGHVYLVSKGELPKKNNDPVAFVWVDHEKKTPFPSGVTFVKLAAGLPGDVVTAGHCPFY